MKLIVLIISFSLLLSCSSKVYETSVTYYPFDIKNKKREGKSSELDIMIASNNSYIRPFIDLWQYYLFYKQVNRETFDEDIACYNKFIEWAKLSDVEKIDNNPGNKICNNRFHEREYIFSYEIDRLTNEPVFVTTHSTILSPTVSISIDVKNTLKLIKLIQIWKNEGVSNQ